MKFIQKFILFFLLVFFILNLAAIQAEGTNFILTDIQLKNGEAAVWYLFHAGWAVKTSSTLMIFDYWEQIPKPQQPSLFKQIFIQKRGNIPFEMNLLR